MNYYIVSFKYKKSPNVVMLTTSGYTKTLPNETKHLLFQSTEEINSWFKENTEALEFYHVFKVHGELIKVWNEEEKII